MDVYDNGEAKTKKIKMVSGKTLECTYNHKWRVVRGDSIVWVETKDLKMGDKFPVLVDGSKWEELDKGNTNSIDLNEAFTLGYFVGDGWFTRNYSSYCLGQGKINGLGICYRDDIPEIYNIILETWKKWFGMASLSFKRPSKDGTFTIVHLKNSNKDIVQGMLDKGFKPYAENKCIPKYIRTLNRKCRAKFLQGLFEADGSMDVKGNIEITSKSEQLIKDIAAILPEFGINYKITEKNVKHNFIDGETSRKYYRLFIVNSISYLNFAKYIGFVSPYLKERLAEKVSNILNPKNRNDRIIIPNASQILREMYEKNPNLKMLKKFGQFRIQPNYTVKALRTLNEYNPHYLDDNSYLRFVCDNEVVFDEVESIGEGYCHTMDLTVADSSHSYTVDGFISHNTTAEILMLRKLYELSCYKNINALFHLMSKTNIMFLYFSVNKTQAERTGFGEMRNWVDNSPYFQEHFKRRERIDSLLVFPEGITFAYGSGSTDSIGMSVIGTIMDEANFIGGRLQGNVEMASAMYAGIVNRANSRFIMDGGINHSFNILVSSATHESSVTERQMKASKGDKHTIVSSPAQWEVKPQSYSDKFFYVFKGSNYLEPHIVESTDDINNFRLSEGLPKSKYRDGLTDIEDITKEIKDLPPFQQDKFLKVPLELKAGFEANIIRSLQDLGGVSTGVSGKLFNSPVVFDACIDEKLRHPFIQPEITISTGDTIQVKDYLRKDFMLPFRERPRFIHIDQSYRTDSTGITSLYVSDIKEEDGARKPIFSVDFMLRINPPKPPKKIAIYKIRDFVVYLHNVLGMKIGKITYDIFNSEESRQILEEMGFNVGYQSVDRTDKAYLDLVEIMYEGRLRLYDYPILRHELFNLIHDRAKRKVDHPRITDDDYSGKGSGIGCLLGKTQIYLQNGKRVPISSLVGQTDIPVYGCDSKGKCIPTKAKKVWETKKVNSYYRITLGTGKTVESTDNHLFLLSSGTYRRADMLSVGDSLMPMRIGNKTISPKYLRKIYNQHRVTKVEVVKTDKLIPVYDMEVPETNNFGLSAGIFVHNSKDVSDSLCLSYDTMLNLVSGEKVSISELFKKQESLKPEIAVFDLETETEKIKPIYKVIEKEEIPEYLIQIQLSNGKKLSLTYDHKVLMEDLTYREAGKIHIGERLLDSGDNHGIMVVVVKAVRNTHRVYDIQIQDIHNFKLDAGVFVHNCGALESALQVPVSQEMQGNRTLEDFLYANSSASLSEYQSKSVEEMIDNEIDDIIESYEAEGISGSDFLLGR